MSARAFAVCPASSPLSPCAIPSWDGIPPISARLSNANKTWTQVGTTGYFYSSWVIAEYAGYTIDAGSSVSPIVTAVGANIEPTSPAWLINANGATNLGTYWVAGAWCWTEPSGDTTIYHVSVLVSGNPTGNDMAWALYLESPLGSVSLS
jgi:hypothetical protein